MKSTLAHGRLRMPSMQSPLTTLLREGFCRFVNVIVCSPFRVRVFSRTAENRGNGRSKADLSPQGNGQHGTTAGRNGAGSAVDRPPRPFTVEDHGSRGNQDRGKQATHTKRQKRPESW